MSTKENRKESLEFLYFFCFPYQDGATSLFLAAQNGHAKVVALILAAASARQGTVGGGGVTEAANVRRTDGATPLWMAAQMGFDNVIRLLMKAGANPEISRNVRKQFTSILRYTVF